MAMSSREDMSGYRFRVNALSNSCNCELVKCVLCRRCLFFNFDSSSSLCISFSSPVPVFRGCLSVFTANFKNKIFRQTIKEQKEIKLQGNIKKSGLKVLFQNDKLSQPSRVWLLADLVTFKHMIFFGFVINNNKSVRKIFVERGLNAKKTTFTLVNPAFRLKVIKTLW